MITLLNTNLIRPPIAPIGLDYVGGALERAGIDHALVDLCLAEDLSATLTSHFSRTSCRLVAVTVRNTDDCFWPSGRSFLPQLIDLISELRELRRRPRASGHSDEPGLTPSERRWE